MTGDITPQTTRRALVAVGVVVAAVVVAGTGTAVAQPTDDPTVTNVSTTTSGGNLTVTVTGTDVSEIDVENVPEDWEVLGHEDDFGRYVEQLDSESRVLWLWPGQADVTVSVTFSVPADPSYELSVVPYAGTTPGESVTVSAGADTPESEPTPTETAQSTDGGDEDSGGDADDSGDSAGESGPGFGVTAAAFAAVVALGLHRRRERS